MKDDRKMKMIFSTLRDIADRGPAVLVLHNTGKDGKGSKGIAEISARVDFHYEVRDATGLKLRNGPHWIEQLPESSSADWAKNTARRAPFRDKFFRLAFIETKRRIVFIDPFVLEIVTPSDSHWSIRDVTSEFSPDAIQEAEITAFQEQLACKGCGRQFGKKYPNAIHPLKHHSNGDCGGCAVKKWRSQSQLNT